MRLLRGFSTAFLSFVVLSAGLLVTYHLVYDNAGARAVLYCAISLSTVTALVFGTLHGLHRPVRSWVLLAISMATWSLGDITYFAADVNGLGPYPSISDAFYLLGYVFLVAGLFGLVRAGRRSRAVVSDFVDVAVISLSIAVASWSLVFESAFESGLSAAAVVTAAYAGGDILLLGMLAAILLNPARRTLPVGLLAVGVLAVFLADVTYYVPFFAASPALEVWSNHSWLLGYVLIGLAGLQRSRPAESATKQVAFGARRLFLVGGCLLALPSALIIDALAGDGSEPDDLIVIFSGAFIVCGLILIRGWLLVTDLERSRLRNQHMRIRLQTIFETAGLGIAIHDGGHMTETNRAFQEMLGYTADELSLRQYLDVVHPDELSEAAAFNSEGPGTRNAIRRRYIHKDGSTILGQLTLTTAPDGRFRIAVVEDITDQARMERQQLEGQKLEAIGRLAGGIAHDFNNLLTGVIGHAELIRSTEDRAELEESVEVILDAGSRATQLVRQLLTFSKQHEFEATEINTADLMRRTAKLLNRILGADIKIDTYVNDATPPVVADPSQIDQVLLNLALNARDAMPDGGTLFLSVGPLALDRNRDAYPAVDPGDYCRIFVSDTGDGMTEETMSRIFEPYFTTKAAGDGTGLGLATSHAIIVRAGGHILVSSEPGRGTTFEILLPSSVPGEDSAKTYGDLAARVVAA